jgi:hypothetical protein
VRMKIALKIVSGIVLLLMFGGPFLIMAWWFLPVLAGLSLWALFKFKDKDNVGRYVKDKHHLGRYVKAITLTILLAVAIWLFWVPWKSHGAGGLESSAVNRVAFGMFGPAIKEADPEQAMLASDRRRALSAIETERLTAEKIKGAIEVNLSGNNYAKRNSSSSPEVAALNQALAGLEETFKSTPTPVNGSLMDPKLLTAYIQDFNGKLDEIQKEVEDPKETSSQLADIRLNLYNQLEPFHSQALYSAVGKVEAALRQSFATDLGAANCENTVFYDRGSDSLIARQAIRIDLRGHKAASVDVSALIPETADKSLLQISIAQDDHDARAVNLSQPRFPIEGAKQITITRTLNQPKASYPVAANHFWVQYRGISVRWPFPLTSSAQLSMLIPDGSNDTWPYTFDIKSGSEETLQYIELPAYSYLFSSQVTNPPADIDKIVPLPTAPRLSDLAWDKEIKVEIMPAYLSFKLGQRFKEYLELETIIGSLIIAAVTAFGLAVFSES